MATIRNHNKDKIRREFETMKSLEISAAELYERIAGSVEAAPANAKVAFANLAKDERHHAELVDRIINLVNNAL